MYSAERSKSDSRQGMDNVVSSTDGDSLREGVMPWLSEEPAATYRFLMNFFIVVSGWKHRYWVILEGGAMSGIKLKCGKWWWWRGSK